MGAFSGRIPPSAESAEASELSREGMMMKLRIRLFTGYVALAAANGGCTSRDPVAPLGDFRADLSETIARADSSAWTILHDEEGATAANAPADSGESRGIGGFGSGN